MTSLSTLRGGLVAAALALVPASLASAQIGTPPTLTVPRNFDTGWVRNDGAELDVIISFEVYEPQASWLRVYFDEVELGGDLPSGNQAILRITSHRDGAIQELDITHVRQWEKSSAYFNGDKVQVEVVAHPGTGARLNLRAIEMGLVPTDPASQCGGQDNRELSSDPRVARLLPIGCTGWMIDDCQHCFLTAGHCQGNISVIQFNVPLSSNGGSLNHPGPEDQYSKDNSSLQGNGGQGVGDDWAYFGTFPNSNTGLTAYEAQGWSFVLETPPASPTGKKIRITGHGTDSGNRNQVQQTEFGPMAVSNGTHLGYRTDTTGGNSGSPVIHKQRDHAIGIHTHGGCTDTGGYNSGTGVNHAGLQAALSNPQGICDDGDPCVTIFADGFESGDFVSGGWAKDVNGAKVTDLAALGSNFGCRLKKDTWIEKSISTVGFTDVELNLAHRSNNYEAGEELILEYWNGASWTTLHATDEPQWHNRNYKVGDDGYNNASFKLRIRTTAMDPQERSDVDHIEITGR